MAIVQDPARARPGPRSAIEYVKVHHVRPAAEIRPLIGELTRETIADRVPPPSRRLADEADMATLESGTMEDDDKYDSQPSPFTCPECMGRCASSSTAT